MHSTISEVSIADMLASTLSTAHISDSATGLSMSVYELTRSWLPQRDYIRQLRENS